eukprot:7445-Heterococcus_DN1.PRE.1
MVKVKRTLLIAAGTLIAVAIVIGAVVGTRESSHKELPNSNALRGAAEPASATTAPQAPPETVVATSAPSTSPVAGTQCTGQRCGSLCCSVNELCSLQDLGAQRSAYPAYLPKTSATSVISPADTALVAAPGKCCMIRCITSVQCVCKYRPLYDDAQIDSLHFIWLVCFSTTIQTFNALGKYAATCAVMLQSRGALYKLM